MVCQILPELVKTDDYRRGMPSEVYQSIVNCVDDSKASDEITKNAYDSFTKLFPKGGWSENDGMEYAWTGIIGMVCPPPGRRFMLTFAIDS
jgi:hypothetical protein